MKNIMVNYRNIKHLRIFGCDAFPLNFNDKDKFEVRAFENCKMIGYGDTDGIYWIYNTENHKIFRSRDVKFNEKSILDTSISITINNDSFKEEENDQEENEPMVILKEEKTVEEEENSNLEENKTDKVKRQRTKTKRYQAGEYDTQSLFSKTCFQIIEPFT
jgi:hypothetical protein